MKKNVRRSHEGSNSSVSILGATGAVAAVTAVANISNKVTNKATETLSKGYAKVKTWLTE